jgi:DNA-binding transcriptional regulator YdaS (Cro superfamily)
MSFIEFAEVKTRCSIEQAAKLLGLQCTKERNQCGRAARRAATVGHVTLEEIISGKV